MKRNGIGKLWFLVILGLAGFSSASNAKQLIETRIINEFGEQWCVDSESIKTDQKGMTHFHQYRCDRRDASPIRVLINCSQNMSGGSSSFVELSTGRLPVPSGPNSSLTRLLRFVCDRARAR